MPPDSPRPLPELGDFLTALRIKGVPIGPADIARLRQLFALAPSLDRSGLHSLLSALLVKTPAQREVFDALFADWCPEHDADWPEEEAQTPARAASQPIASGTQQPQADAQERDETTTWHQWRRPRCRGAAGRADRRGADMVVVDAIRCERTARGGAVGEATPPIKGDTGPDDLPAIPVDRAWFWRAEVNPQDVQRPWRLGPVELAFLGLVAWGLALWSWWRYRQRFPSITPVPRSYRGYGWQPLPPPARDDGALVEARDRRQMVWNIEHFVTDDPTRWLHLPETVDATARAGGYVRLCFEPAVYEREIWFWLDRQLDRSTPRTAVQQLITTLAAAGLEARQGLFTDVPDRVDWPAQPGYRPAHEEGQGRQALVAIFSDGEGLARQLDNPLYRQPTERLLRGLQRWPRLCFVDCSTTGARLAALLAPYGLETIALADLPYWLGGMERRAQTTSLPGSAFYGDARAWAAAVALGGVQVETASAHSLRVALGLNVSPWLVDQILAEARHMGARHRLINWLLRCEPLDDDGMPQQGSLAQRALDWWQQRYSAAAQQMQAQENPLLPWQDSLASQRWQLEQALLRLYLDPVGVTRQLAQLADDELRDDVRAHLAEYAAAEHRPAASGDDSAYIYCTWRFAELTAATQQRLRQLGFAAGLFRHAPAPLKDSPRLALAGTVLVMLGMTASGGSSLPLVQPRATASAGAGCRL